MKKTMLIIFLFTGISIFADGVQPVGSGTEADPYQVETLDNLLWISTNSSSWSSYFEQIADIDASSTTDWNSGAGFSPIGNGSPYFTGSYNGQDHTIDGLFINRYMHYVGLFGYTNDAEFDNIGLTNVDIAGNIDVGGLVGWNFYSPVSNCYTTGIVSGTGGQVGGLVGLNYNSTEENSFWDTETSGQSSSIQGTGKTTAEMKNVRTYTDTAWSSGLDSPWDFVTNPYDDVGTDDHWNMDGLRTNDGYPFLNWQDVEVLPDAPANIIITMVGNDVELNWDAVTGATSYSIYSSDDPYAVDWGTAAATGIIGTSWSELIPDEKKFYYVTAVN